MCRSQIPQYADKPSRSNKFNWPYNPDPPHTVVPNQLCLRITYYAFEHNFQNKPIIPIIMLLIAEN